MNKRTSSLLLIIILLATACSLASEKMDPIDQTLTPLSAIVIGTATARAENEGGAGEELATAVVEATARSQVIYATQTARASLNDAARLATATVIAPVVAELPRYGIDPAQGYVAWIHKPVTIDLYGYQQTGYANDYQQITAKDFVMAADINWTDKNSLSACGFMFRSNGDQNKPSQYNVIMSRVASGHLAFTATIDGEIGNIHAFFPYDQDKSFQWQNGTTNRLAVVVRGAIIDIYTNGVLIGEVDTTKPPPNLNLMIGKPELPTGATPEQLQVYQNQLNEYNQITDQVSAQLAQAQRNYANNNKAIYSEGLLGFIGMSQSGSLTCKFSNAWLFIIER
jgi:hypothetical protein